MVNLYLDGVSTVKVVKAIDLIRYQRLVEVSEDLKVLVLMVIQVFIEIIFSIVKEGVI